jgi:hypothetical protein
LKSLESGKLIVIWEITGIMMIDFDWFNCQWITGQNIEFMCMFNIGILQRLGWYQIFGWSQSIDIEP